MAAPTLNEDKGWRCWVKHAARIRCSAMTEALKEARARARVAKAKAFATNSGTMAAASLEMSVASAMKRRNEPCSPERLRVFYP